jgi:hypothetical protein
MLSRASTARGGGYARVADAGAMKTGREPDRAIGVGEWVAA